MLTLKNVSYSYDKKLAVDDISLKLDKGENVGIVGANGAGKSTLFSLLCGMIFSDKGEIEIDGNLLTKKNLGCIRRLVGLVFQNPDDQLFMPTVYDDVAFSLRNAGYDEKMVKSRVEHVLTHLNILHLADRAPYRLSGGEKRRAAIAGAIAIKPEYILFDEPTAFLDPKSKREFSELYSSIKTTKIIAGHDLLMLEKLCDRIIILKEGKLVYDGKPNILKDDKALIDFGL